MNNFKYLEDNLSTYQSWRHHFHRYPELAFKETGTADNIEKILSKYPQLVLHERLAGTGMVVSLSRGSANKSIGLRADMDALALSELSNLDYKSQNEGVMHACGHDGHTVMLLAAIDYLVQFGQFDGTVYFIFQPAEEIEGGGKEMVEQGLFKKFPMDAVFAMHNWPGLPAGQLAFKNGPVMASFDMFDIVLSGKGGHAAKPHLVKDPIVASAHLISAIQGICSRETNPLDEVVVSITQISAGSNYNIIPQQLQMKGTVRSFSKKVQKNTRKALQRILDGICLAHGISGELKYSEKYPATINHDKETQIAVSAAKELLGEEKVSIIDFPSMGAEDFSFMLNQCPGCYFWIGNGKSADLHNPAYNFNDEIIPTGAAFWVSLVQEYLS